ncbi:hypothetical protein ACO0K9_24380 [Undibacterium sp. Ji50W]|uniref:hypothetical protein n=1 Tax=Undibacterium sp. Ji50W TaxID=3413041 RepID=UPI003BF0AF7C
MGFWKQITSVLLTLLFGSAAMVASAEDAADTTGKILFICEHGNVKSLMAVSYFNKIAQERHLPFVAVSRGIVPDSITVPPPIVDGLRQEGFDVAAFHPTKLTALDIDSARRAIAISVDSPISIGSNGSSILAWNDVPPASVDFKASSASLKAHIEALLTQLTAQSGQSK